MINNLPNRSNYLSISLASSYLGISIDTLRLWEKQGKIKSIRKFGKRYFDEKEISGMKQIKNLPHELLSITDACRFLGISKDTIRRWEKKRMIQSQRSLDGIRFYKFADLSKLKDHRPVNISQAADKLGISVSTIRRMEKRGQVTFSRNTNGMRLINDGKLEELQKITYGDNRQYISIPTSKSTATICSKLNGLFRIGLITGELILSLAIIIVISLTLLLISFPEKTAGFIGYQYHSVKDQARVLGMTYKKNNSNNVFTTKQLISPFGNIAMVLVKHIDNNTYKKLIPQDQIADINDVFFIDTDGQLVAKYKIKNTLASDDQINANSLQGHKPGKDADDVLILDSHGDLDIPGVIASNSVVSSSIQDGAVTNSKIKNSSITGNKLANDTITALNIKNGSISGEDLEDGIISTEKLKDDSVTGNKIKDDSISSSKIQDKSISAVDLMSVLAFDEGSMLDLSKVAHTSSTPQGLLLPQADTANIASPYAGEGYLAWDKKTKTVIVFDGIKWLKTNLSPIE